MWKSFGYIPLAWRLLKNQFWFFNPATQYGFHASHYEKKQKKIKISEGQTGDKNQFYGRTHSEETKKYLADCSRKWLIEHPEQLKKMISKSFDRQKNGLKTSIELKVQQELEKRGMSHTYSKILQSVSGKAHDFSRGMKANDATNINIIIHIPKTKST